MKENKFRFAGRLLGAIAATMLLATLELNCMAQGAFDIYGGTRTIVVAPPQTILTSANNSVTNLPVDIHHLVGQAKLDLICETNVNAGTWTVSVQTSASDATNWTALTYALSTSTSAITTNLFYPNGGSTQTTTNTFLLPGTITTPTAGTAGWATAYLSAAPYTNTGSIAIPASGVVSIGFNADDAGRFIRTIWTPAGSSTNAAVTAILTGRWMPTPTVP